MRTTRKRKLPADRFDLPPQKHIKTQTAISSNKLLAKTSRQNGTAVTIKQDVNTVPTARLEVFVVGDGDCGELGLGPQIAEAKEPCLNQSLTGVVDIAAGGMHSAALTADNKVLTWGVNDNWALGRDSTWEGKMKDIDAEYNDSDDDSSDEPLNPRESTPTAVSMTNFHSGARIVQVVACDSATFVLTADGAVYGWGTFLNREGKEAFYHDAENNVIEKHTEPVLIYQLKNITQLSAGVNFCLALDVKGTVFSWGMGEANQLGRRVVVDRRTLPNDLDKARDYTGLIPHPIGLSTRTKIVSIHTGCDHAFAIDTKGDTWAWGLNNFAQTGIAEGAGKTGSTVIAPQKIPSLIGKKMKIITGGAHHSTCVTQAGECMVWGRVDGGTSGLDVNKLSLEYPERLIFERGKARILIKPTPLPIPTCTHVTAGSDHTIAITREGKAYSWGFNVDRRCGPGAGDEVPIAAPINTPLFRNKKLTWAGAGGRFSIFASPV